MNNETLIQIQKQLEQEGRDLGAQRYDRRTDSAVEKGREDGTSYGSAILSRNIGKIAGLYEETIRPRQDYRVPAAFALVKDLPPQVLAMVTLGSMLASATKSRAVTTAANKASQAIFQEYRKAVLQDEALRHFSNMVQKKGAQGRDAVKLLDYVTQAHDLEIPEWDEAKRVSLGRAMIEIVIQATGLFAIEEGEKKGPAPGNAPEVLVATPALLDWISKHREDFRLLSPVYLPMVVSPKKWNVETAFAGCYLTDAQAPIPFVKRKNKLQMKKLRENNPERVFEAVNAIQETAWRIRKPVLSLLKRMLAEQNPLGMSSDSIPTLKALQIDEEAPFHVKQAQKKAEQESANLRLLFAGNVGIAEKFSEFEEIFIPHHLDSRGRVYPIPSLNPQGADYVKALLEFAEGKVIGDQGILWLKIHTANLFGVDKVPFEDRISWVNEHWNDLLASALDPFENLFWTQADKPFQAFAACVELLGVSMEGPEYVSRIAIALDGSCSGLQHLGAAFRCEVTGRAVNLIPGDRPNDIYKDVAKKVSEMLRNEKEEANKPLAEAWLAFCGGEIGRSVAKRPVMTYPYGSKAPGFTQQLLEDVLKPAMKAGECPFENPRVAAQYLAGKLEKGVSSTVLKAAEAMDWMQASASAIASCGKVITWTTPLGFPVVQEYRETKSRRIDSVVMGKRFQARLEEETDKIDTRKMANAISPNVVHSLDSSHLMMTVLSGKAEGIDAFALIHDSFGTHAADTPRFFQVIREAFVELYSEPVFENLEREFLGQVDQEALKAKRKTVPTLPTRGDYDLELILDSLFAFA